jgi:RHS repeat-associated protein
MSKPSRSCHSLCLLENGTITIGFLSGLLSKSRSNENLSEVITMNMKLWGRAPSHIVYFNGQRIARRDLPSGNIHYYFSNHLGSASLITDSSGNIQQQTDYYPYGGIAYNAGADANRYKFTGKERDTESGLDNFGARYDASSLGRFMTPDWAAKPTTVPYALFGDPQTLNLYAYVRNNPVSRADADGHCADHYKDGTCKVNVDPATGQAGAKAGKQLEGALNKYDKAVNALNDKDKFKIRDSNGKVIGSMTGKEFKAVWNGTSFDVTNKSFNNGGAGGGTGGTWSGDSFSGRSELTPGAVSAYANAASARNEAPDVGVSTLEFHELAHETKFGEALTKQYPVTPTISWPREQGTSSAGKRMSDAVGAPFDCSIPGGCQ